jgi:hypothetical protein
MGYTQYRKLERNRFISACNILRTLFILNYQKVFKLPSSQSNTKVVSLKQPIYLPS